MSYFTGRKFTDNARPFQQKSVATAGLTYKSVRFTAKDVDEPTGRVTAAVNSLEVKDLQGDIVHRGAWTDVINKMMTRQAKWPTILDSHEWSQRVGKVIEAWEGSEVNALMITGKFNMDTQRGREAFSDVKKGLASEWSVGFMPDPQGERYDSEGHHITKVGTWPEVSIVLMGASPGTRTLETKGRFPLPDHVVRRMAEEDRELWAGVDIARVEQLVYERLGKAQRDDSATPTYERYVDPDAPKPPFNPTHDVIQSLFDNPIDPDGMDAFLARLRAGVPREKR